MREITQIRKLSLWIFIIPLVAINFCLFISQNPEFLENTIFNVDQIGRSGFSIPYFDGSLSISRASRTFPQYLIFKPGMWVTAIMLYFYWKNNNDLINHFNLKRLKISNLFQQTISKCELLDNLYIEKNNKYLCHLFCFFIKQNKYGNNQDFIKILDEKFKIKIVNRFFPMNLSSIMRTKQTSSNLAPINLKVWFNELISLPIYPKMRKIEINYIRNSIIKTHDIIRYGKS